MSPDVFSKMNAGKVLLSAGLVVTVVTSLSFSKTDVPLFLFSGQSNMVGMGALVSKLSADQKKQLDNVKIYMELGSAQIPEGAAAKEKKWLPLGPGFGNDESHFGPELFFGKTLVDSFPDKKFAFVKDAVSGTYLGKPDGWLSPSSNNGTGGILYKRMMATIDAALSGFNSAYDTALYAPKWAGFIWLQGEFDGWQDADKKYADAYETNLSNLIKDIRAKTSTPDLPVIIPMIYPGGMWKLAATIRAAEVALTTKLENCDTTETKDYNLSDVAHYDAAGMIKIGTISAQRWIAMKYLDVIVPIINMRNTTSSFTQSLEKSTTSFDLTGRKIVQFPAAILGSKAERPTHMIINVDGGKAEKVLPVNQR